MQFSIRVDGVSDINRELKKYSEDVRKGVAREVAKTINEIRNDAVLNTPVHTGKLRQSIHSEQSGVTGSVWVGAEYGVDVEQGQKPGRWPNVGDLMFWVKKKIKPPAKKLRSVTFLIGRKIFERGTQAQQFFEPAIRKYEKRFYNNIERLLNR